MQPTCGIYSHGTFSPQKGILFHVLSNWHHFKEDNSQYDLEVIHVFSLIGWCYQKFGWWIGFFIYGLAHFRKPYLVSRQKFKFWIFWMFTKISFVNNFRASGRQIRRNFWWSLVLTEITKPSEDKSELLLFP